MEKEDLESIYEEPTIERYLRYPIDFKEDVECFLKETDLRFSAPVKRVESGPLRLVLAVPSEVFSPETLLEKVNNTTLRTFTLSFRVQETILFITGKFERVSNQEIKILVIAPLYKLQRRQTLRFKPDISLGCVAHFPEELRLDRESAAPFDVSAGGFSILLDDAEAKKFSAEGESWTFRFSFTGLSEDVQCSVKTKSKDSGDKEYPWKVGFQFVKISPVLEQRIAQAAVGYTQRLLAKRI